MCHHILVLQKQETYSPLSQGNMTCFVNNFSISLSIAVSSTFEKPILLMVEQDGGYLQSLILYMK